MTIDPELITAYADGEADRRVAPMIAAALAADPTLAALLHQERETIALIDAAVGRPVEEALPAGVAALLAPRRGEAAVLPFPACPAPQPRARPGIVALAAAAAVLLTVGLGGGWVAQSQWVTSSLEERIAAIEGSQAEAAATQAALAAGRGEVLEHAPNGAPADWRSPDGAVEGQVTPLATFVDADGRFCRQFSEKVVEHGQVRDGAGIACRVGQANWRLYWGNAGEAVDPTSPTL